MKHAKPPPELTVTDEPGMAERFHRGVASNRKENIVSKTKPTRPAPMPPYPPPQQDFSLNGRPLIPPGASGYMPMSPNAFYKKPSRKLRFYRWLGFTNRRAPQPETPEFTNGFSKEWFSVAAVAMFTWRERLLILISGRILCHQSIKTDKVIKKSNSTCVFSVLPPGYLPNLSKPSNAEIAAIRNKIL